MPKQNKQCRAAVGVRARMRKQNAVLHAQLAFSVYRTRRLRDRVSVYVEPGRALQFGSGSRRNPLCLVRLWTFITDGPGATLVRVGVSRV